MIIHLKLHKLKEITNLFHSWSFLISKVVNYWNKVCVANERVYSNGEIRENSSQIKFKNIERGTHFFIVRRCLSNDKDRDQEDEKNSKN